MNPISISAQVKTHCRACGSIGVGQVHAIPESMYGSGEIFDYVECPVCESLQIMEIPEDLAAYYPADYYSQAPRTEPPEPRGIKRLLYELACETRSLNKPGTLRRAITAAMPLPGDFREVGRYLSATKFAHRYEQILDVGCGSSPHRLAAMKRCGFSNVKGIDPFVASDNNYYGVPVRKCTISETSGEFALVMFHHSLEHVSNPVEDLTHARRLLRRGGLCILRLPISGGYFWRHFQRHWVELDAPRHLLIPTKQGLGALAKRAGLIVERIEFDSEPWEMEASRQYQRGISLKNQTHYPPAEVDSKLRRVTDALSVQQLNALADGGRGCLYLRNN